MSTDDTIVSEVALTIPGYHIQRVLGSGAMGKVYLATQTALERPVAIKVIAPAFSIDQEFRQRFLNEGKIIGQLRHPHIVTIHDIGESDGHYYMVMEYIEHGTLKERIQQGMPTKKALAILRQVASALAHAHKRGFIHRDVKPANVLFRDDDNAVLSDFGIAKATEDTAHLTATGLSIGTLLYMSPEQAQAKPLDGRSDLYSLGLIFYEMLVGRRPNRTEQGLMEGLPRSLSRYQTLLDKLIAPNPDRRFADAEQCVAAVDALTGTTDLPDEMPTDPRNRAQTRKRASKSVGIAAAVVLILGLIGGAAYHFWPHPVATGLSLDVKYSYRFANQNNFSPLKNGGALHSGDHYRLSFVPAQSGFVYIFQIDSIGAVYQLFPSDSAVGESAANVNPVQAGVEYFVPGEDRAFQLDEQVGQEQIYILAFRDKNLELENQYAALMEARRVQDQARIGELHNQIKSTLRSMQAEQAGQADAIPVLTFEHLARGDHAI
ncbi:MAG: protein kinase [Gammaproteobacteria bacterium]|nr:protein kinase [Gammaproteobacteria bacterium]